jgi:hypothetical protein
MRTIRVFATISRTATTLVPTVAMIYQVAERIRALLEQQSKGYDCAAR